MFSGFCGLMGHWYEECGNGEHDEDSLEWGNFVLADGGRGSGRGRSGGRGSGGRFAANENSFGRGRGNGDGGFGRGRGRGDNVYPSSWRFNAVYQDDHSQKNDGRAPTAVVTTSQPARGGDGGVLGKRLADDSVSTEKITDDSTPSVCALVVAEIGAKKAAIDDQFEGSTSAMDSKGTPQKNANRKKSRAEDGTPVSLDMNAVENDASAAPLEGDRRER